MIRLGFLRHGRTDWNQAGRIQGRVDIPLSAAGRQAFDGCRLPAGFEQAVVYCSPLQRAVQTAALLGHPAPHIEPRLIEMAWGDYEGRTLAALRTEYAAAMRAAEALGLDFQPPGGESPRQVQGRLTGWLTGLARQADAAADTAIVAITHKGVIRAALALAYDWNMTDKPPVKIAWTALQVMWLDGTGRLTPAQANLPLRRGAAEGWERDREHEQG